MRRPGWALLSSEPLPDRRRSSGAASVLGHVLVFLLGLVACYVVIQRMGTTIFLGAIVGLFLASIYTVISFRNLAVPFAVWVLSIGGFKFLWNIQTPLLPDLYLDRIMMLWVAMVFLVQFFAQGRKLRGPFRIEAFLIMHAGYLLARVFAVEERVITIWVASYFIPYLAFFLAKNIVTRKRQMDVLFTLFLVLSIYYHVTSIAEKYEIAWLVWPRHILEFDVEWIGRSNGPFGHAPLFGTVIGMLLPVHLFFIARARSATLKLLLYASLASGMLALYFTYTRGSWLAGIMALLVTAALNRRRYFRILAPAAIIGPIFAVLFLGLAQDTFMRERVETDHTVGGRLGTAITVVSMWRDNPLFGVGFKQYINMREQYLRPVEVPGLGTVRQTQFRSSNIHDMYLGPLAEDGLVGQALQFAIFFFVFKSFVARYRRRDTDDEFAAVYLPVFAGICVGYLVGGLAIDYRYFSFVGTLFYLSAGIVDGYRSEAHPAVERSGIAEDGVPTPSMRIPHVTKS